MCDTALSIGQCAALAAVLEVTAPKPGNVHRSADFEDVAYPDFVLSAMAIAPVFERAAGLSVGQLVLRSVQATRQLTGTNTNLGMLLLLAPLAKVPASEPLALGLPAVLAQLSATDAAEVYAAIRHAQPGGLGTVREADVAGTAPESLLHAMQLAADRDLIARQYVEGFPQVLMEIVPWLKAAIVEKRWPLPDAIVHCYLQLLASEPDSLIARKCGTVLAAEASARAAAVLRCGEPGGSAYQRAVADLDRWLRGDRHRRNPGTTADLIAAGLFVCLRDGIIQAPFNLAASLHAPSAPTHRSFTDMFTVRIEKDHLVFSAGHFITYDRNVCERLHGHNYRVAVEVEGSLDANQYVIDFLWLRNKMQSLIDRLDHRMLLPLAHPLINVTPDDREVLVTFEDRRWVFPKDDCVLLPVANTTSELLAQHLGQQLLDAVQSEAGVELVRIRLEIDECFGQIAIWEHDHR